MDRKYSHAARAKDVGKESKDAPFMLHSGLMKVLPTQKETQR